MRVIEINRAGPNAPIAWIEAGIHARQIVKNLKIKVFKVQDPEALNPDMTQT